MSRRTNTHTLYVTDRLSGKNPEELKRGICSFVESGIRELRRKITSIPVDKRANISPSTVCNYVVNVPRSAKTGAAFNFGYVWIEVSGFYHAFIGNNPDGSKRVERKAGKFCTKSPFEQNEFNPDISWGDLDEEPEELVTLPGLITSQDYTVEAAFVNAPDDNIVSHIFKSVTPIPTWLNEEDIKKNIRMYASDRNKSVSRMINGQKIMDTYPLVNYNKNRIVSINWDPSTNDGQFAMLMCHKLEITKGKQKVVLSFRFAQRNLV